MVAGVDVLKGLAYSAVAGDDRALEEFIDATYEQVWRFCAALVDEESADDLAQETFIRAVRTLPRFRGDASVRTWLLAIARHICLDEFRARSRRRRRDALIATTYTEEEAVVADASQNTTVNDLLKCLDPDRRSAFVLTQMFGFSYDEAARVCECPRGTIRSRVARARVDLLELLGQPAAHRYARSRKSSPSA